MKAGLQRLQIWASTCTSISRRTCRVCHYKELASADHLHVLRAYRIRNCRQRHAVDRQCTVRLLAVLFLANRSKLLPQVLHLLQFAGQAMCQAYAATVGYETL